VIAAPILGYFIHRKKASDLASAIIAIDLLIVCIVLGLFFPIYFSKTFWFHAIFIYIFLSSVVPVWIMGQPRNYLNSFLLVATIVAAFIGVIFTSPKVEIPAFSPLNTNGEFLFPILFTTIACGAISGFHSVVVTGITSKQITNEKYMLPASYGTMLVETLVGVLALIAVGSVAINGIIPDATPPVIFATAVSAFLNELGLPLGVSFTIVSLAVSSFILTTLDTIARLGRLAFRELFAIDESGFDKPDGKVESKKTPNDIKLKLSYLLKDKSAASLFTLVPAYLLAIIGYQNIWTLFGASNQLLAALTLLACTMFFKKSGRKVYALIIPTIIILIVSYSSLVLTIKNKIDLFISGSFSIFVDGTKGLIAVLLLVLGILVAVFCAKQFFKREEAWIKQE
jgi:carbon starvation protein